MASGTPCLATRLVFIGVCLLFTKITAQEAQNSTLRYLAQVDEDTVDLVYPPDPQDITIIPFGVSVSLMAEEQSLPPTVSIAIEWFIEQPFTKPDRRTVVRLAMDLDCDAGFLLITDCTLKNNKIFLYGEKRMVCDGIAERQVPYLDEVKTALTSQQEQVSVHEGFIPIVSNAHILLVQYITPSNSSRETVQLTVDPDASVADAQSTDIFYTESFSTEELSSTEESVSTEKLGTAEPQPTLGPGLIGRAKEEKSYLKYAVAGLVLLVVVLVLCKLIQTQCGTRARFRPPTDGGMYGNYVRYLDLAEEEATNQADDPSSDSPPAYSSDEPTSGGHSTQHANDPRLSDLNLDLQSHDQGSASVSTEGSEERCKERRNPADSPGEHQDDTSSHQANSLQTSGIPEEAPSPSRVDSLNFTTVAERDDRRLIQ